MKVIAVTACLLAISTFTSAFDVEGFKKNCVSSPTGDEITCSSFNVGLVDDRVFQNENFVISNAKKVTLRFCTLRNFNENFVSKFPNAEEIIVFGCMVDLKNVHSPLSVANTKLQTLTFEQNNFYDDADTTAFDYLVGLRTFNFKGYYVSSNTIGNTWFTKTVNLARIEITDVTLESIGSDAFVNLKNLEYVNISGTGLEALPTDLFQSNTNLKTLIFNGEVVPL